MARVVQSPGRAALRHPHDRSCRPHPCRGRRIATAVEACRPPVHPRNPMGSVTATEKRQAFATLPAGRLRELADRCDLKVADRRSRDDLLGALADGRRLDFATVLEQLSRNELKAMCAALGLDDSGREKALLVARLLGDAAPPKQPSCRRHLQRRHPNCPVPLQFPPPCRQGWQPTPSPPSPSFSLRPRSARRRPRCCKCCPRRGCWILPATPACSYRRPPPRSPDRANHWSEPAPIP